MTASVQSPADVVNLALVRIGHSVRIGSLYEGSTAAKKALDIYGQTRDELMRALSPGFAQRELALELLKQAPPGGYNPQNPWNPATNPPLPWGFEYVYPADCLKFGSVRGTPPFLPDFDPQPKPFIVANDDTLTPAQRVILCHVPGAVGTYVAQVTDPTTWDVSFVESFAAQLGRRLAIALAPDPKAAQLEPQDEQTETAIAGMIQG